MSAGVGGTLVETQCRDIALDIGSEFHADFDRTAVGDRRLGRHRTAVPYAVEADGNGSTRTGRDVVCCVFRPGVESLVACRGKSIGGLRRFRPAAGGCRGCGGGFGDQVTGYPDVVGGSKSSDRYSDGICRGRHSEGSYRGRSDISRRIRAEDHIHPVVVAVPGLGRKAALSLFVHPVAAVYAGGYGPQGRIVDVGGEVALSHGKIAG